MRAKSARVHKLWNQLNQERITIRQDATPAAIRPSPAPAPSGPSLSQSLPPCSVQQATLHRQQRPQAGSETRACSCGGLDQRDRAWHAPLTAVSGLMGHSVRTDVAVGQRGLWPVSSDQPGWRRGPLCPPPPPVTSTLT